YEAAVVSGDAAAALRGKRATWSSTLGFAVCDPEVEKLAHEAALALCADAGIELIDVDVRFPRPGRTWSILSSLDTSAQRAERAIESLPDVTPVPRAGLEMIRDISSEGILRAIRRRDELMAAMAAVFDEVDIVLTPTTATTAFVAEGPPPLEIAGQSVG